MADNGRWFKLWCSSLGDPDMDSLDIADFGRWAKLGAYIKEHGEDGEITLTETDRTDKPLIIVSMLQLSSLKDVFNCAQKFKNVSVSIVTNTPVSIFIKYQNWYKYQGDFSTERVREHRAKKHENETPKKRREEKREEERRKEENKDYLALSDFFLKEILAKNPHSRLHSKSKAETEKLLSGWAADFRLLVEKDKQPMELIRKVITATTSDSFWSKNVLSGKKLREKWDTLVTLVPFVECPNIRTEKTVLEKIQESERNET